VLGGAGILVLLLWRLGTNAFLDGLSVIDGGTVLVALGIGLVTTVFSAWRWCLVARGLGLRLPLVGAVADYYRALFLNAALPGGVLGDVHRAVRHGQDVGNVRRGVKAVVLERAAGQIVVFTLGLTVLLVLPSPALSHLHFGVIAQAVAAVCVVTVGAVALIRRHAGTSRCGRAAHRAVADLRKGLLGQRNGAGILVASVIVLAGHLATFLVAARAAGSSAPIAQLAPLMVLALLAMTLPVNVGGWGPREGVLAWAFAAAGLGAAQGLTIAVVYGLLAFVASLPGIGVLAVRWVAGLRAARPAVVPAPAMPAPVMEGVVMEGVVVEGVVVEGIAVEGIVVEGILVEGVVASIHRLPALSGAGKP
jgi:uncharacterized membrane protein YbhN (UPF0104 family)